MYPDEIKVVIDLRKKGKSYREIGNILDLSKSTVQNLSTYKKSCYKKKRSDVNSSQFYVYVYILYVCLYVCYIFTGLS